MSEEIVEDLLEQRAEQEEAPVAGVDDIPQDIEEPTPEAPEPEAEPEVVEETAAVKPGAMAPAKGLYTDPSLRGSAQNKK